ncbi:PKD domain-containing protein [Mesorhizobium sp. L-8-3]|uniref:PKD domain-containing protein n=1 Tax=Mesorhizobium sp. L-8-3 TaxID=2744522 RepID=UPI001928A889|nr:PKD domain-containing protein [Mesorhizobium sp. L-8-3]BCH23264.1 hypothetical protein MesoLjLb_30490 [Mesorhizobium sp. L-8-3]
MKRRYASRTGVGPALVAAAMLHCGVAAGEEAPSDVGLVTFGPMARVNEGDHDFRQVVRIALPEAAGTVHVRVYDPDAAGTYDEPKAGFDTTTRFSLFGDGATARLSRDAAGVVQESIDGTPLATAEFGADPALDGRWTTLFSVDAAKGSRTAAGAREFLLLVEGLTGNDGNVFDVTVSRTEDANQPPEGLKLSSFLPTFQVPRGNRQAELGFDVPADAEGLTIENFDAAAGSVAFAGRFRSDPLTASAKSQWGHDDIALDRDDTGRRASVTATGGSETPNDITVFVGARKSGADAVEQPLAIDLPIRAIAPNRRPATALAMTQFACGRMRFDASASRDPDGGTLTHRWRFDAGDEITGAAIEQDFAETGMHAGRLESFDASGVIGDGSARDFTFLVKPPPTASFEAPGLVAEGAALVLDGTGSKAPALPEGIAIVRYRWTMGDGTELVQSPGDPDFGRPNHRYAGHGAYKVTLTVTDGTDNPCNSATTTRTVTVNAPPVANAGGNRRMVTGEIATFDAAASSDPDGTIVSYLWDFGDGGRAAGPAVRHAFHRAGDYQVRLSVLDDSPFETGKGFDTVTVTVPDPVNRQPTADAGPDRTAYVGEAVRFDASRSVDPDGEIQFYAWDFGDGSGSDSMVVEHSFWQPGTYPVSLAVTDNGQGGNTRSVASTVVTVLPAQNRPPVADFPREFTATTFRPLALDASTADDRDGSVIAFEWDFGDGSKGSGPKVSHQYGKPGVYDARLTLRDNGLPEPAAVGFDFKVHVADKVNLAPVANAGKDVTVKVGEEVTLDGSASSDPDGSILSYRWDLGDGNSSSGIRNRHIYQFPGTYPVKLTIGDDGPDVALVAGDEFVVTVLPSANAAPVAALSGPTAVRTGEVVLFDGQASADPDGNILQYRWDFGDGGVSNDASPRHTFHAAGTYDVRLRVTDDGVTPMSAERMMKVTVTDDGGDAQ